MPSTARGRQRTVAEKMAEEDQWDPSDWEWQPTLCQARKKARLGSTDTHGPASTGPEAEGPAEHASGSSDSEVHVGTVVTSEPAAENPKFANLPIYNTSRKLGTRPENICVVEGCGASLAGLKRYFTRLRICEVHLGAQAIVVDGVLSRFCQQCGRFQPLGEFTGKKKSCTERLEKVNARHREKAQQKQQRRPEPSRQPQWHDVLPSWQGATAPVSCPEPEPPATLTVRQPSVAAVQLSWQPSGPPAASPSSGASGITAGGTDCTASLAGTSSSFGVANAVTTAGAARIARADSDALTLQPCLPVGDPVTAPAPPVAIEPSEGPSGIAPGAPAGHVSGFGAGPTTGSGARLAGAGPDMAVEGCGEDPSAVILPSRIVSTGGAAVVWYSTRRRSPPPPAFLQAPAPEANAEARVQPGLNPGSQPRADASAKPGVSAQIAAQASNAVAAAASAVFWNRVTTMMGTSPGTSGDTAEGFVAAPPPPDEVAKALRAARSELFYPVPAQVMKQESGPSMSTSQLATAGSTSYSQHMGNGEAGGRGRDFAVGAAAASSSRFSPSHVPGGQGASNGSWTRSDAGGFSAVDGSGPGLTTNPARSGSWGTSAAVAQPAVAAVATKGPAPTSGAPPTAPMRAPVMTTSGSSPPAAGGAASGASPASPASLSYDGTGSVAADGTQASSRPPADVAFLASRVNSVMSELSPMIEQVRQAAAVAAMAGNTTEGGEAALHACTPPQKLDRSATDSGSGPAASSSLPRLTGVAMELSQRASELATLLRAQPSPVQQRAVTLNGECPLEAVAAIPTAAAAAARDFMAPHVHPVSHGQSEAAVAPGEVPAQQLHAPPPPPPQQQQQVLLPMRGQASSQWCPQLQPPQPLPQQQQLRDPLLPGSTILQHQPQRPALLDVGSTELQSATAGVPVGVNCPHGAAPFVNPVVPYDQNGRTYPVASWRPTAPPPPQPFPQRHFEGQSVPFQASYGHSGVHYVRAMSAKSVFIRHGPPAPFGPLPYSHMHYSVAPLPPAAVSPPAPQHASYHAPPPPWPQPHPVQCYGYGYPSVSVYDHPQAALCPGEQPYPPMQPPAGFPDHRVYVGDSASRMPGASASAGAWDGPLAPGPAAAADAPDDDDDVEDAVLELLLNEMAVEGEAEAASATGSCTHLDQLQHQLELEQQQHRAMAEALQQGAAVHRQALAAAPYLPAAELPIGGGGAAGGAVPMEMEMDRVAVKALNFQPGELPANLREGLGGWLQTARSEALQATLRPGCLQLVIDVLRPLSISAGDWASQLLPAHDPVQAAADVFSFMGKRLRDTFVQVGDQVLLIRVGEDPVVVPWELAAEEGGMPGAKRPAVEACSVAAVCAGSEATLELYGRHLIQSRGKVYARLRGRDLSASSPALQPLQPSSEQAGSGATAAAAGLKVTVNVPTGVMGLMVVEVGVGHLLGGWWPVLVLVLPRGHKDTAEELLRVLRWASAGVRQDVSRGGAAATPQQQQEEELRAAHAEGRRLVIDLGHVLDVFAASKAAAAAAATAAPAAAAASPVAQGDPAPGSPVTDCGDAAADSASPDSPSSTVGGGAVGGTITTTTSATASQAGLWGYTDGADSLLASTALGSSRMSSRLSANANAQGATAESGMPPRSGAQEGAINRQAAAVAAAAEPAAGDRVSRGDAAVAVAAAPAEAPSAASVRRALAKAGRLSVFSVARGCPRMTALLLAAAEQLCSTVPVEPGTTGSTRVATSSAVRRPRAAHCRSRLQVLADAGVDPQALLPLAVLSGSAATVDQLMSFAARVMHVPLRLDLPQGPAGMTLLHLAATLDDGGAMAKHLIATQPWAAWSWLCLPWTPPVLPEDQPLQPPQPHHQPMGGAAGYPGAASASGAATGPDGLSKGNVQEHGTSGKEGVEAAVVPAAQRKVQLTPGSLSLLLGHTEPLECAMAQLVLQDEELVAVEVSAKGEAEAEARTEVEIESGGGDARATCGKAEQRAEAAAADATRTASRAGDAVGAPSSVRDLGSSLEGVIEAWGRLSGALMEALCQQLNAQRL